ncbi:MAG: IS3 family transposase [Actinobacteria bacterium]|nr:IS3 family transposase [Actinomycetota bacterium]
MRPDRGERVHRQRARPFGVDFQRARGERCARAVEDERLSPGSASCTKANSEAYGSRRIWKTLLRADETVGRGRVERLMSSNGIQGAKRRRTTVPGGQARGAHRTHDRYPHLTTPI